MKTPIAFYMELLHQLVKEMQEKQKTLPVDSDARSVTTEKPLTQEKKMQIVCDNDLTISIRMLENGYTIDEVIKAIKESSPFRKIMSKDDPRAMAIYIDEVLENVNKEWTHRVSGSFDMAKKSYDLRLHNLQNKYKNYKQENFGLYQDGELALDLVRRDGFTPEIAEAVISRYTSNQHTDDIYFGALHEGLTATLERYKKIADFDRTQGIETEADVYRMYAKDFMEKTQTEILSGSDEQKILESIYDRVIEGTQAEQPYYREHPEALDSVMDEHVLPLLRKGVVDASPVYTEPGRDRDQYVSGLLAEFQSNYEMRKHLSSERYPETLEKYQAKIRHAEEQMQSYLDMHSQSYFDGVVAKELLHEHYAPANIIRSIVENTKVETADIGYPNKEAYGQYVLDCAERSINAEAEIKNINTIPVLPKSRQADQLGVSAVQLYQYMMKERLLAYPSFEFEMSEANADRDAVEKLLNRYPDISDAKLEQAIAEASPRAQLPGAEEGYAKRVVREAKARLRKVRERAEQQDMLQKKYNTMRGISSQGVYGDNPMNSFKDGHITIKMLRRQLPKDDIKAYLVSLAETAAIAAPLVYAQEIIAMAQHVLDREHEIATYKGMARMLDRTAPHATMTELDAEQPSCTETYMEKMHEEYEKKGFCQPAMDIRVMKEMMDDGRYKTEQIQQVILDHSPVAAEPGRDENYADYVRRQAELKREKEKERIDNYIVVPRIQENELTPREEYEYQRNRAREDLGITSGIMPMAIDAAIFSCMLAEGFSEEATAAAMTVYAPQGWSETHTESYGDAVKKEVSKNSRQEVMAKNNGRVRVRTTTETVTTVTKTTLSDA